MLRLRRRPLSTTTLFRKCCRGAALVQADVRIGQRLGETDAAGLRQRIVDGGGLHQPVGRKVQPAEP
jgi:hypothetical protein